MKYNNECGKDQAFNNEDWQYGTIKQKIAVKSSQRYCSDENNQKDPKACQIAHHISEESKFKDVA
jgi:hypothetical protein